MQTGLGIESPICGLRQEFGFFHPRTLALAAPNSGFGPHRLEIESKFLFTFSQNRNFENNIN